MLAQSLQVPPSLGQPLTPRYDMDIPFRLRRFLPLGHVPSEDLLLDSLKEKFGMGLILFFWIGELTMTFKGIPWIFST